MAKTNETMGRNLRALRQEKGLTQDELARELGISRSAVGMYEQGKREPDFETLEVITDYFNVDMVKFLGYDEDMPEEERRRVDAEGIRDYEASLVDYLGQHFGEDAEPMMAYHKADRETKEMIKRLLAYADQMRSIQYEPYIAVPDPDHKGVILVPGNTDFSEEGQTLKRVNEQ